MKKHQTALERHEVPDDSLRTVLNAMARERFLAAGYQAIGFDHYALPSDELAKASRQAVSTETSWATPREEAWIWWRWVCPESAVWAPVTPKTSSQSKPGERRCSQVNPVGIGEWF